MPLHSASDLDQRRLNTLNSKDGSTFPQNVFLPYPQNHPKTIFWGTFQCKTYYTDGRLGGSVKTTSAYQARSSASVPRGIVPTSPRCRMASRQHLRSATQQLLVVPRHQLSSYGRRAFCVAGPSVWNSLPDSMRNPIIGGNSFGQSVKTFLLATY